MGQFSDTFNAIATAIKAKDGGGNMTPAQMAGRISSFPEQPPYYGELYINGVKQPGEWNYIEDTYFKSRGDITSIVSGCCYIGVQAFRYCTNCTSVVMPNLLNSGNISLGSLGIQRITLESLVEVAYEFLYGCNNLKYCNFPKARIIKEEPWEGINNIEEIHIPNAEQFSTGSFKYLLNSAADVYITNKTYDPTVSPWSSLPWSGSQNPTGLKFHFSNGVVKYIDGAWTLITEE